MKTELYEIEDIDIVAEKLKEGKKSETYIFSKSDDARR